MTLENELKESTASAEGPDEKQEDKREGEDQAEAENDGNEETADNESTAYNDDDDDDDDVVKEIKDLPHLPWPKTMVACLLYTHMEAILTKGKQQFLQDSHLVLRDLYAVPEEMEATRLVEDFWSHYQENKSLLQSLGKIAIRYYAPGAVWELTFLIGRLALPLSLRALLQVFQDYEDNPGNTNDSMIQKAWPYCVTLTLAGGVMALAQARSIFLSTQAGIAVRATLTAVLYQHSLSLTAEGRSGVTTGQVTNLVAVDTQKLFDVCVEGQNLWSCPLLIVVASFLLWTFMGPELLMGVAILLLFLPFIQRLVKRMLSIRKQRSSWTDKRIQLISTMLHGMRVTKLNHYEQKVQDNMQMVREEEMKLLRQELRCWGWVLTFAVSSPILAFGGAMSFYVLSGGTRVIQPSDAFSALLLFSILRFPVNLAARVVGKAAQALDSIRRIDEFLNRETRSSKPSPDGAVKDAEVDDAEVLKVEGGQFNIDMRDTMLLEENQRAVASPSHTPSSSLRDSAAKIEALEVSPRAIQPFSIQDINLSVRKSQLVIVVGRVGSGKTMLLRALLGELPSSGSSAVQIRGTLSYGSQEPFILNASVRENITFGSNYNKPRYEAAIEATDLHQDLARLGKAGDLTQIGERGVTLSGGQKQRVALARAIYANPTIALLDDCFSALDPSTARTVFNSLFCPHSGILRNNATILVTHALQFLPHADLILVMHGGKPMFTGTYKELRELETKPDSIVKSMVIDAQEHHDAPSTKVLHKANTKESHGIIMTVEEREYGLAAKEIWFVWCRNAGGWTFALAQITWLCLDRGLYVASDWWIAVWSQGWSEGETVFGVDLPAQTEGLAAQRIYVSVYIAIILISVMATLLRSLWAVAGGARCARSMFQIMAARILRAPMSYFDTTPTGRIINRFTYDVEVMDIELSVAMTGLMMSSSWLISSVAVMLSIFPWIVFALIPVTIVYYYAQLYYRMSGPDLQRLDAVSRSPLQASLAEALEGAAVIRAYNKGKAFASSFRTLVNANSAAMMNHLAGQRWLGLRIELLGAVIFALNSFAIVLANDLLKIPAGYAGLLIQWSVVFNAALGFFFSRLTETEARLTSIERIHRNGCVEQEAEWETSSEMANNVPVSWPNHGELEFDHVCMRYRRDLPLALESVSFKLPPCCRCGVVGRTGSGKTSLTACLFRLVEIESGHIRLDGVDLARVGLSDVRGRSHGMRVIPQDPVLYAGTLRDSLDPFQQCRNDDKLVEALQAVQHEGALERGAGALNDVVEEGGTNLSIGERQLLCLARAIVEEPRVLVLDEATASVDNSTDALIQQMLRTRFQNTTLLTIAHRLHTIMDYDCIVVMDDGHVAQFGPPWELLEATTGIFASLVDSTGTETSNELRKIALAKQQK